VRNRAAPAVDAAAQLKRLLAIVPRVADGEEHEIAAIAELLGVSEATVLNDLVSVGDRYDTPGGFIEGLQVFIDARRASVRTSHFLRPMRLTAAELRALDLGLAMIRAERTPAEWPVIDSARARIRAVVSKLRDESVWEGSIAAPHAVAPPALQARLGTVREALAKRRKLRIAYRRGDATEATTRVVSPYRLILAGPGWYLIGFCERSDGVRVFRLDRVEGAELLGETCAPPDEAAMAEYLARGPVFASTAPVTLRVRFSPRIARWVAEREPGTAEPDGSYVVDYPMADVDWAVRHVLQYGPEAEILQPAEARRAIRARLAAMLG